MRSHAMTTTPSTVRPEIVAPGTTPPYDPGERCQVLVGRPSPTGLTWDWHTAVVLSCTQPPSARRFVVAVALAQSIHSAYLNGRVYCNADGRGDEVRPLVDSWPMLPASRQSSE